MSRLHAYQLAAIGWFLWFPQVHEDKLISPREASLIASTPCGRDFSFNPYVFTLFSQMLQMRRYRQPIFDATFENNP
jgi:hypothetical protein